MTLSPEGLTAATSVTTPIAVGFAAVAGLGAAFGPSTYPLVPAVLGYGVTRADDRRPALIRALWIVAGMAVVDGALGAFAGAIGEIVARIMAQHLALSYALAAVIALVLGLRFLRVVRFRIPSAAVREAQPNAPWWEPFALGLAFGVAACPACTPLLLAVLLGAAAVGKIWFGALLLSTFALARGVPLIAVAFSANMVRRLRPVMRFGHLLDVAGGLLLLATAAYFCYLSWFVYTGTTTDVPGMPGM